MPHLQDIYNHLSSKKRNGLLKDHKVTGNLHVKLSFHLKERWEDIITRHTQSFGQQDDMFRVQTISKCTQSLCNIMTSWWCHVHVDEWVCMFNTRQKEIEWSELPYSQPRRSLLIFDRCEFASSIAMWSFLQVHFVFSLFVRIVQVTVTNPTMRVKMMTLTMRNHYRRDGKRES